MSLQAKKEERSSTIAALAALAIESGKRGGRPERPTLHILSPPRFLVHELHYAQKPNANLHHLLDHLLDSDAEMTAPGEATINRKRGGRRTQFGGSQPLSCLAPLNVRLLLLLLVWMGRDKLK
jgi:hypothetical protein